MSRRSRLHRRIGTIAALWGGVWVASPATADRPPEPPGRTVLTQDALAQAGVTRVGDILFLVDGWVAGTADGYTFKASPNGLTAWQKQRWIVLIDGQRADLDTFDAVNLNLLPVGLDQIDSVVVVDTPRIHGRFFADAGLIHFHTRQPAGGPSLRATLSGGNETGDPGPYRFTDSATPNIDSMGPDGSLTAAAGGDGWRARANATYQVHYFTDFAIQRRTFDIIGIPGTPARAAGRSTGAGPDRAAAAFPGVGSDATRPGMHRYTLSAALFLRGGRSRHNVFWGYSRAEKYFLYSEPVGREVPMDVRYHHAGVDGRWGASRTHGLDYRLQFTSHGLTRYPNVAGLDYDWNQRRLVADGELFRRFERFRFFLGGGYELRSIETADLLEDNPNHFGKLYGGVELDPDRRVRHEGHLFASFFKGSPSLKAHWTTTAPVARRHRLTAQLSFAQRGFAETGDLWYWVGRGYGFTERSGIAWELPAEVTRSNTATADLTWAARLGKRLEIGLTAIYRDFSDVYFEKRDFAYEPAGCTVTSGTEVVPGNAGRLAGGSVDATLQWSPELSAALNYRYLGTLSGDPLFERVWKTVPDHRVSGRLSYRPAGGFSIWARVWYYSASEWESYAALEDASCAINGVATAYSPRVEAFTSVDVTLRKLLWSRHLAADLAVRNLFDDRVAFHPLGASLGLTFYVQLSLALPAP